MAMNIEDTRSNLSLLVTTISHLAEEFDVPMTRDEFASRCLLLCFGVSPQRGTVEYDTILSYIERLGQQRVLHINGAWYSVDWSVLDILETL